MPSHYKEDLQKRINKNLQKDLITPCHSAYSATVLLVPKKTGKLRLVIDNCQLNKRTFESSWPFPSKSCRSLQRCPIKTTFLPKIVPEKHERTGRMKKNKTSETILTVPPDASLQKFKHWWPQLIWHYSLKSVFTNKFHITCVPHTNFEFQKFLKKFDHIVNSLSIFSWHRVHEDKVFGIFQKNVEASRCRNAKSCGYFNWENGFLSYFFYKISGFLQNSRVEQFLRFQLVAVGWEEKPLN